MLGQATLNCTYGWDPQRWGGGIGTEEQAKPARRSGLWCQFKDRSLLGRLFWAFANLERQ